jgi:plastocyanin
VVPEDAPVIAAEDSNDFCLPVDGDCEVADHWEVTPSQEVETVAFVFDNREAGTPHNVVITELENGGPGEEILESELISGPAEDFYSDPELTWDELPDEWYFFCRVHAGMNATGSVVDEEA